MKLLGLEIGFASSNEQPTSIFPDGVLAAPGGETRWDANSPQAVAFFNASDMDSGGHARILGSKEAWRKNPWTYVCVSKLSEAISSLPWFVEVGGSRLKTHWVYDLIGYPNKATTEHILKMRTSQIMLLEGEAFWFLGRDGFGRGKPREIYVADPSTVTAIVDRVTGDVNAWRFRLHNGEMVDIDPLDVCHFMMPNPYNRYRGMPPLTAASLAVTSDVQAAEYNIGFFARGARPHGVLWTDQKMNQKQIDEVKAKWNSEHRLSHNVAVLHSNLQWKDTQITQHDMEFNELRKSNMHEVAAVYGVPPIKLGFTDAVNYANGREQGMSFWRDSVLPKTKLQLDSIEHDIVREGQATKLVADTSGVEELREADEKKMERGTKLFAMGVPFADINKSLELGLPSRPWYKVGFLPFSLAPVDSVIEPEEPETPPPPADDEEQVDETVVNSIDLFEKKMIEALREYQSEEHRATAKQIADDLVKAVKKDNKKLKKLAKPYIRESIATGIAQAADLLGDIDFDMTDPRVVEFMESKLMKITGINDVTSDKLRDLIAEDLEAGMSIDNIADDIRDMYNKFSNSRAKMIARTEVGGALSFGRYAAYEEEGVTAHEWMDSGDDRTRNTHAQENGNVVAIGEEFPFTHLTFPGDPEGEPEEIINCRCVTIPAEGNEEEGYRLMTLDRGEYMNRVLRVEVQIEKRFTRSMQKFWFQQRAAVLAVLDAYK